VVLFCAVACCAVLRCAVDRWTLPIHLGLGFVRMYVGLVKAGGHTL
jgi:hypothetical protein